MYGDVYNTTTTGIADLGAYEDLFQIGTGSSVVSFLLSAFLIFCLWKIFEKAGKPGWASLIPIYNMWVLFEIVGMKGALSLLILIPILGLLIVLILDLVALFKLAGKFGKSGGFGVGLIFLPYIFLAILALDKSAVYQ